MVGNVGLEPTEPKASDLQSDVIAAIRISRKKWWEGGESNPCLE